VWVPVYDTETWEATPAPRLARAAETMMSASFAGGLIADSEHRDILNQFLDNTIWERVGVLPKDTTLLDHEKVTL
jgi:hypothetical protein